MTSFPVRDADLPRDGYDGGDDGAAGVGVKISGKIKL
jgi:hypothetical protein